MELTQEIIAKVENDLRRYPDWIVRLEVGGLGIPSRAIVTGGSSAPSTSSLVERDVELSDETKRKVMAIEMVYDRLHGKTKDIIDYRYFQSYNRNEVLRMLRISKRQFYYRRDMAIGSFARALGYIE
ncbi:MAG TPA: nitroreductase [Bacillota bacterium]|nr:nitroreductase [Bacillota bacterium]